MIDLRWALVLTLGLASVALAATPADEDPYALEGRAMREPNNFQVMMKAGRVFTRRYDETHNMVDQGKAENFLASATQLNPRSNEAIARYAVAKALRARDKNDKGLAKQVLKELDQACTAEPNNLICRALRGYVEVEVPSDFNRMDQGLADLQFVEEAVKKDPGAAAKYELDLAKTYMKLGKAYRARGKMAEAKRAWEAAVAADPNSKDAQAAKRLLQKF